MLGDDNLSRPAIAYRLERFFCSPQETYFAINFGRHDLAPRKDLAVSLLPFCPYSRIGPTSLGLGPPEPFGWDVTARTSILRMTAVSCYVFDPARLENGVRTFLPATRVG